VAISSGSVSLYFVAEVFRAARSLGLDAVVDAHGKLLEGDPLAARVPLPLFCNVLEAFATTAGEDGIGFLLGERLEPSGFNLLGHLVMASASVGDALRSVERFQVLVIDCAEAECREESEQFIFSWRPREPLPVAEKPLLDLVMAAMRAFGIWVTGITEPFSEIRFQYPQPQAIDHCFRLFGHGGVYGCGENGFVIPLEWCRRPIRSASENLRPIIHQQASLELERMSLDSGLVARTADIVLRLLPSGHANIERVAELIGLSARSLQRRLNARGNSFSDVLQRVRLQQANHYLQNTRLSLSEIAARLGYREQSSFSNAYRTWTGKPPRQQR
jgi:AraC-like DNA-binding protein